MDKDKFVFLTGLKPVTVVSADGRKSGPDSKSPCCKRYKKGKSKCKDCPEEKPSASGLKLK